MTARFSVHVRLWWACESDAFEVKRGQPQVIELRATRKP
jgi:hypothetical protein